MIISLHKIFILGFVIFISTYNLNGNHNLDYNGNNENTDLLAPLSSITIFAWLDFSEDGIRQSGESGVADITLQLYNEFNNLVSIGVTGADGLFTFNNIPNGKFRVKFNKFSGLTYTHQNIGGNEDVDSDVDLTGYSDYLIINTPANYYYLTSGYRGNLQVFLGNNISICHGAVATLHATTYFGKDPFSYAWDNGLGSGETKTVAPLVSTIYKVTVTDALGFTAEGEILVRVKNGVGQEKHYVIDDFGSGSHPPGTQLQVNPINPGPISVTDYSTTGVLGDIRNVEMEYISGVNPSSIQINYSDGYFSHSNDVGSISRSKLTFHNGTSLNFDISRFQYFKFKDVAIDQGEVRLTLKLMDNSNNIAYSEIKMPGLGTSVIYDKDVFFENMIGFDNINKNYIKEMSFEFNSYDSSIDLKIGDIWFCEFTDCPIKSTPRDMSMCLGDSVTIGAQVSCSDMVTFLWDNNLGYGNNFRVSPTSTTTYNVTAIDAYGCTSNDVVNVTVYPIPSVSLPADIEFCQQDSVIITANVSGGTQPYNYVWSNGATTQSIKVSPSINTIYSVTVSDVNNCKSNEASINVKVNPKPTLVVSSTLADCTESNGSATAVATGGTLPYTYVWNTGFVGDVLDNIPAGNYHVTVTDSKGCSDIKSVFVEEKDCGLIGNFVWEDLDYNGIQENGEAGISNVQVILYNELYVPKDTVYTDISGQYYFFGLKEGDYYVKFIKPTGYYTTKLNAGNDQADSDADLITGYSHLIQLAKYEKDSTIDAGFYKLVSIGDTVWVDVNGNGLQENAEPGLAGFSVQLLDCNDAVLATTTTDQNGKYEFKNLNPGDYKVRFLLNGSYKFTLKNVGTNINIDSDANTTDGKTACEQLISGENNVTYDAGVYIPAQIGNFVWEDLNANGIQDSGEPGIANVPVQLNDCNGVLISTVNTNATGYYLFDNLAPGNYKISVTKPTGYIISSANVGNDSSDSDLNPDGFTACETLESGETNLTYDIGMYRQASIGDKVWEDKNGNGIQDSGETGVGGVTVVLETCAGVTVSSTTTNSSGNYLFENLTPGNYRIRFVLPASYMFTVKDIGNDVSDSDAGTVDGITACETLVSGETNLTYDAGLYIPAKIGDFVWEDINANGIQDSGEPGIANVPVQLNDCNGVLISTVNTNATGYYLFDNLAPGNYKISVTKPAGFTITTANVGNDSSDSDLNPDGFTACETLESGETNLTYDIGMYKPASIGDKVWEDKNGNGTQDSGETGVGGVTVVLETCAGVTVSSTTTNSSGNYLFENLTPGNYRIRFVLPSTYKFTGMDIGNDESDSDAGTGDGTTVCETLISGESNLTYDAGIYILAKIGDFVWEDLNANGVQDSGEPGLANVPVQLNDCNGVLISTVNTNATGYYLFDNLAPGNYKISVTKPTGYIISSANVGNDSSDSDLNPDGFTACETLESGETNLTYDIGMYRQASIGDKVWEDKNGNGIQDSGETGVGGVTVVLETCAGVTVSSTTTNSSGNYLFENLTPGNYRIRFVLPASYMFTVKDIGNDVSDSDAGTVDGITACETLVSGETNLTYDAGLYIPAKIGDFVWEDINANGIQDSGEPGIANVPVQLNDCNGVLISTVNTNATGYYLFDNLAPGNYKISVTKPAGFTITTANVGNDSSDSDLNPDGFTACETLESGETNLTYDIGMYKPASIGDKVWEDKNGNGTQDSGETGVGGVTVVLETCAGVTVSSTTTNSSGNYLFEYLTPGNYRIRFVLPSTYKFTGMDIGNDESDSDAGTGDGTTVCETLISGESNLTYDAGIYILAKIGDFVWEDLNANGVQDSGEPGIGNVPVQLNDCNGVLISTVNTNATGYYLFDNLAPGNYKISVTKPTGYIISSANVGNDSSDSDLNPDGFTACETLESGETNLTYDIGMYRPASIGDKVWLDKNGNGIQENGENGVSNITVRLETCGGNQLQTATSNANGNYLFEGLTPGSYRIKFELPADYYFTKIDIGSDLLDSDPNPTDGITICESLISGESNLTYDAGIYKLGALGDKVWLDENGNGIQDINEPGFENVEVQLQNCNGTILDTKYSDANGLYLFNNLVPDQYRIKFIPPLNYSFTKENFGSDDKDSDPLLATGLTVCEGIESGEANLTYDAGLVYFGTIGDYVWEDLNGDGKQQNNEPGIANVALRLYRWSNNAFVFDKQTVTNSQGFYIFEALAPGNYYIKVVLPSGFETTIANEGDDDAFDSDADNSNGIGTTMTINLSPTEDDMTWDFGLFRCATISDLIWNDMVRNNIYDVSEGGLDGVLVRLWRKEGNSWIIWDQTYTAYNPNSTCGSGYWSFCTNPGEYYVQVVSIENSGFIHCTPNVGNDESIDSDITDAFGLNTTNSFVLVSGDNFTNIDFGFFKQLDIKGQTWIDANGDGIRAGSEAKLAGITVQLFNSNGPVDTRTTDSQGKYEFIDVQPDAYYLKFSLPSNYVFTLPNVGTNDDVDSDVTHDNGANTTAWFTLLNQSANFMDAGYKATGNMPFGFNGINGVNMENYNFISWRTNNDDIVSRFEVLRNIGSGEIFNLIEMVNSNRSDKNYYHINDFDVTKIGTYRYKIKAIVADSNVYSNEVLIDVNMNLGYSIFPNPVSSLLNFEYVGMQDESISYIITDLYGKVYVNSKSINVKSGQKYSSEITDLYKLPSGVYQFILKVRDEALVSKFVKINE